MTNGRSLSESRPKGKLDVIRERYRQRIERHNLNLKQHLAKPGKSGCRSQNRSNYMINSLDII
jgi:insertion element IS1 protein InsB